MPLTATNICTDALLEINVVAAGDVPDGTMLEFVGGKLKRLFDAWNAKAAASYADLIATFTLTVSLSPHTIGLAADTPTWTVTVNRPQTIDKANLILPGTSGAPDVLIPITIRDKDWYDELAIPDLESSFPTDLYYNPTWPKGSLYFYPVPSVAYQVELITRIALAQLELTDTFTLPPGYQDAVTLTLAEEIAGPFGKAISRDLERRARERRAGIFDANTVIPRLQTQDAGMPGGDGGGTGNYLQGWQ